MDSPASKPDAELVQACLDGDARSWHALVDRYEGLVYDIARRSRLPTDLCDDVFQTVFLALVQSLGKLRDHASITKWLMTTTRRECSRAARRRLSAQAGLDENLAAAVSDAPPEAELEAIEDRFHVRQAVARLEPRCRELLTALFLDRSRPDYETVASRLGMPLGSIGPVRARCLRKLLDLVEEAWEPR